MANANATTSTIAAGEDTFFFNLFEPDEECICEFGDLILVANDGYHPVQKMRVSSCILAMSSKPFKVLFSKKFAEGNAAADRSADEPHEIELKDEPGPLKHLCQLLHHKIPLEIGSKTLSASSLLELGQIADKFDCVDAIRLQSEALLGRHLEDRWDAPLDVLATAACLLDQPRHFRRFTKQLVKVETMIQPSHFLPKCLELLPVGLISSLANQQGIARQELSTQVGEFLQQFSKACKVTGKKDLIFNMLEELRGRDLSPVDFKHFSLSELLLFFSNVEIPLVSTKKTVHKEKELRQGEVFTDNVGWGASRRVRRSSTGSLITVAPEYEDVKIDAPTSRTITKHVKKVEDMCVGVCLDCIRGKQCRQRHRYCWGDTQRVDEISIMPRDDWGIQYEVMLRIDVFKDADDPGYWEDAW